MPEKTRLIFHLKGGLIKARNFRNARNKAAYLYVLTPGGIEEKARVARAFLARKLAEYEEIQKEITELEADIAACREAGREEPESAAGTLPGS